MRPSEWTRRLVEALEPWPATLEEVWEAVERAKGDLLWGLAREAGTENSPRKQRGCEDEGLAE